MFVRFEAYLTESAAAIYPRIILDKSVFDLIKNQAFPNSPKFDSKRWRFDSTTQAILSYDFDDKLYFDYFTGALVSHAEINTVEFYEKLRETIIDGSETTNPSVKIKIGWLKVKFNNFIKHIDDIEDLYHANFSYLKHIKKID
ncbi:hypothetical protein EON78_02305 [bacterium]|nr:MAG: hypothetical protein EON78_02305 [bacterium]